MRNPSSPPISIRSAVSERSLAISLFSMLAAAARGPIAGSLELAKSIRGRLDMNQNVRYPVQPLLDLHLHLRRDFMRLAHSEIRINLKVQIDVIFKSGATSEAFFDAERSRYAACRSANLFHRVIVGHGVGQLIDGAPDDTNAHEHHNKTNDNAADVIGGVKPDGSPQADTDR